MQTPAQVPLQTSTGALTPEEMLSAVESLGSPGKRKLVALLSGGMSGLVEVRSI